MSAAAERIQRAHELVRKYRNTPLFLEALAHLRDVVDAVKREASNQIDSIRVDNQRMSP